MLYPVLNWSNHTRHRAALFPYARRGLDFCNAVFTAVGAGTLSHDQYETLRAETDHRPMTELSEEQRREQQRLADEHGKIRDGIVSITMAWAAVESAMVMLLAKIIRDEPASLASAIFFSLNSIEARTGIVDSALSALLYGHEMEEPILKEWGKLQATLRRLRQTRNKVAHGSIITVFAFGKNHARLTAPIFRFRESAEAFKKGQLPGMSGNDIQTSAAATFEAAAAADKFTQAVPLIYANDIAALRQVFPPRPPGPQSPDAPHSPTPKAE